MMKPVCALALAVLALPHSSSVEAASVGETACLGPGESMTLTFQRPPLTNGGLPTSAQWLNVTGNPLAFDEDTFSDDYMGPATVGGTLLNEANVTITNVGNGLAGPNGEVQTGLFEGDCLEVIVCWSYRYKDTDTRCTSAGVQGQVGGKVGVGEAGQVGGHVGGSLGGSSCHQVEVWRTGQICSGSQEVCQC